MSRSSQLSSKILGLFCLLLLGGILYAGLKPFHAPANQVAWVRNVNALSFGEYGTMLSSSMVPSVASQGRSLEIWIEPALLNDSSTIVAFYNPVEPRHFALHQSGSDLELTIESSAAWRYSKTNRLYVDNAFRARRRALWAVTAGPLGTAVYRDGVIVREESGFRPSSQEFSGRLVVGTSPIFDESWSGNLYGLSIYNRRLDATQIARHYVTWTKTEKPDIGAGDGCIALYLFTERKRLVNRPSVGRTGHGIVER